MVELLGKTAMCKTTTSLNEVKNTISGLFGFLKTMFPYVIVIIVVLLIAYLLILLLRLFLYLVLL